MDSIVLQGWAREEGLVELGEVVVARERSAVVLAVLVPDDGVGVSIEEKRVAARIPGRARNGDRFGGLFEARERPRG